MALPRRLLPAARVINNHFQGAAAVNNLGIEPLGSPWIESAMFAHLSRPLVVDESKAVGCLQSRAK
jgi:hypothetical protein